MTITELKHRRARLVGKVQGIITVLATAPSFYSKDEMEAKIKECHTHLNEYDELTNRIIEKLQPEAK